MKMDLVLQDVFCALSDFEPRIVSQGSGGRSKYIRFKDERLGSLRVSDHKGREKYRHKWNLWVSGGGTYEETDRGARRFHFRVKQFDEFVERFKKYSHTVKVNSGEDLESLAIKCGFDI